MSPFALPELTVLDLVNAAKSLTRAKTDKRRVYWLGRLIKRVAAYEEAEGENKARLKDKDAYKKAAEDGNWIDKDGKLTPYTELGQDHIERILTYIERRWTSPQEHPHWDGLLIEIRRRVPTFVENI